MNQDDCKNCEELIATLVRYHPEANVDLVERAYRFAEKAHEGQFRKSGEPYFTHPLTVASILAKLMLDAPTIAAGLLHDTVEDCETLLRYRAGIPRKIHGNHHIIVTIRREEGEPNAI